MGCLHIAICEDDAAALVHITGLVKEWAKKRDFFVRISEFPHAEGFWFQYAEEQSFDVLLLDIEMGEMSGVELAKRIRESDRELQIIFVTGYMEYIAQGYDVEALHYLLKPVSLQKLEPVLDRASKRAGEKTRCLFLSAGDGTVRLPLYEIRYLEVQKNYVTVHAKEAYTVKRTLREMEKELDDSFYRTGRSYMVNLRYVVRISRNEVALKDGERLPLSRGFYEGLNRAFIQYFQ